MLLAERRKKQAVAGKIGHDEYQYKLNGDPANYPDHQPVREPRVGNLYNNNNIGPQRQQQQGGLQPPYAVDNNNNNNRNNGQQQQLRMMPGGNEGGHGGLFANSPPFAAAELFSRPQYGGVAAAPLNVSPATPLPPMGPVAELPALLPPVYKPKPPLYFHGQSPLPSPLPLPQLQRHVTPLMDAFTSPQVEQVVVLPPLPGPQRPNTTPSAMPTAAAPLFGGAVPMRNNNNNTPVSSRQGRRVPSAAAAFHSDLFAPDGRSEQELQRERKLAERRRAQEVQAENARQMAEHQRRRQEERAREIAEARAAEERLRREREAEAAKLAHPPQSAVFVSAESPSSEAEVVPVLVRVPRRNSAAHLGRPLSSPTPSSPASSSAAASPPTQVAAAVKDANVGAVSASTETTASSYALSPMPPTAGLLLNPHGGKALHTAPEMTVIQLSTPNPPTTLHTTAAAAAQPPSLAQLWPPAPPPSSFLNDPLLLPASQRPLWHTPPRTTRSPPKTPRPTVTNRSETAQLQHEIDALAAEQRRLSALLMHPPTNATPRGVSNEEAHDVVSPMRTPRSASGAGTYLTTGQPTPRVGNSGVVGGGVLESDVSAHAPPSFFPLQTRLNGNIVTPPSPRLVDLLGEPKMQQKAGLFALSPPPQQSNAAHDTLIGGAMRETTPFVSRLEPSVGTTNSHPTSTSKMDSMGVDLAVSSRIVGGSPRPTVALADVAGVQGDGTVLPPARPLSTPRGMMGVFGDPELTAEPSQFIGIA